MKDLNQLLTKLNIKYKNKSLYEMAFTHSSFNADANTKHKDYERLEFLGDSVLGAIVSELAYKARPDFDQGTLTKLKSYLVNSDSLASFAKEYHFDEYIRVGNSFAGNVSQSHRLLEDVFEAFLGAMYLDLGYNAVHKFLVSTLYRDIQKFNIDDMKDYKSRLQEEMQSEHRESVQYVIIKEWGPPHDRHFIARVLFEGVVLGEGEGHSKKVAEQMAAKAALNKKADR